MHVNKESLAALGFMLPYLPAMPLEADIDFKRSGHVSILAHTQDEVRAIRHAFPGFVVWTKQWNKTLQWLEYTAVIDGHTIEIFAVKEAPARCEIVEEEVEVEEDVPVAFEKQLVRRTVRRMVCPEVSNGN